MDRDFWYYRRRAAEEATAAHRSIMPAARERHAELAEYYRSKLDELERQEALA